MAHKDFAELACVTYKDVCEFQKKTWYQVYYIEKICDTMANQDEWRPSEKNTLKLETQFSNKSG